MGYQASTTFSVSNNLPSPRMSAPWHCSTRVRSRRYAKPAIQKVRAFGADPAGFAASTLFTGAGLHAGAEHETAGAALAGKRDCAMLASTNMANINPKKPNTILAGSVIPPPVSNIFTPHSGQRCCVFMYSTLKNRLASNRSVHSR